jgi:hypothetical protein
VAPASTLRTKFLLSSLASVAILASASSANAFSVKKTTHGDFVHWETDSVSFTIDPSVDQNVDQGSAATKEAMQSWSGSVGAPDINVITDPKAPTAPSFDHKNGVFYAVDGYEPAGKALAITVLTYDNASGKILDADVVFNGIYAFKVMDPKADKTGSAIPTLAGGTDTVTQDGADQGDLDSTYDLHHVVAHELGHSLGMNDEMGNKSALMYRYTAPNDATLQAPASDDITGLAELYSTKAQSSDSGGCGSNTVSPKNPTKNASNAAMLATFGLLVFLVLRARSDKRARLAFMLASAAACIAFMPKLSGGNGVAKADTTVTALGHARARVFSTSVAIENGLFKTQYQLTTTTCRASICPKSGKGVTFGGTIGNITQEVGGYYAPNNGDEVDVSFKKLPNALGPVSNPLMGRIAATSNELAEVKVLTRAN